MTEVQVVELAMELCREGQRNIKDFTKKGKCSKCGECCFNLLPLAHSEIERIVNYVSAHKITINKPKNGSCPFLSKDKKCLVYEARPLICRLFKCSAPTPSYKDFMIQRLHAADTRRQRDKKRINNLLNASEGGGVMPKNNLSLRLDDEERAWLEEEAKSQQRSIANLIRYILREYRETHCSIDAR